MSRLSNLKQFYFLISFSVVLLTPFSSLAFNFNYKVALVRELANSFENSLKLASPSEPISLSKAQRQHEAYISLIQMHVIRVNIVPRSDGHPDSNFIEDTAIILGDLAIISHLGALSRRGEEVAVHAELQKLGLNIARIQAPATLDGGDVLWTGPHLFVGLSQRTNRAAVEQLKEILKDRGIEVHPVSVVEGLHLKSLVSHFDTDLLVVPNTQAGLATEEMIRKIDSRYSFVRVPDTIASNVLRIGKTVIAQKGFPESEAILKEICTQKGLDLVTIEMSELIKADGALTCGSLLL